MHDEQLQFVGTVKLLFPAYFEDVSVLEVGSYDVNGSVRSLFNARRYLGLDLIEGPGVDLVCPGQEYDSDGRFDVAISAECFEHNPHYLMTFSRMAHHTRDGGLVLFTCASEGREEHGTSRCDPDSSPGTVRSGSEYYRKT